MRVSPIQLTPEDARYLRLHGSGLIRPFADAVDAANALIGVQAQILPAAGLAIANRTPSLNHAQLDTQLYQTRTLIKLWGQRGTLHLYAAEDWPLIYAMRAGKKSGAKSRRNSIQAADAYQQIVDRVAAMLKENETLGRSDLRAADLPLTDAMLSPWGGLFAELVRMGIACHAERTGGEARFAHRANWLPHLTWSPPPPDEANQTTAARYFRTYAPASWRDFTYWRGATQRNANAWFDALDDHLFDVEISEGTEADKPLKVWAEDVAQIASLLETKPDAPEAWPVHMLYRFDPLLLGLRDKAWVVPAEYRKRVWRPSGHIEGVLLVHGNAAATWRYQRKGRTLDIQVQPFKRLPRYVSQQLPDLSTQIATFFDLELGDLRIERVRR